jgi:hypothetical protein
MEQELIPLVGLGFIMLTLLFVVWMMIKWNKEDPHK